MRVFPLLVLVFTLTACQAAPGAVLPPPTEGARSLLHAGGDHGSGDPVTGVGLRVVPEGVTASSSRTCFEPERAVDGNPGTHWSNGLYLEPEAAFTLAFAERHDFSGVKVKTGPLPPGVTFKFATSDDGENWDPASGRLVNTTWGMEFQDVIGTGRYLRLRIFNHMLAPVPHFTLYEIEVFEGA